MRYFIGMFCVTNAIAIEIIKQLNEDNCICAECWFGFRTLYKSLEKDNNLSKTMKQAYKEGNKYWESLSPKTDEKKVLL